MDLRAEVKALCVQELQLRFVNARMAHALSVRSRKVRGECETRKGGISCGTRWWDQTVGLVRWDR